MKKEHQLYSFLADPEFVKWVNETNKELDTYWENWLAAHPERTEEVKKARELLLGLEINPIKVKEEEKKSILQNILAAEKRNGRFERGYPIADRKYFAQKFSFWFIMDQWMKIAAILILTALFSILYNDIIFEKEAPAQPVETPVEYITKITKDGEKLNFQLPDGTVVWLNSRSELTFPVQFDSLERLISLKGEAFFEVRHDSLRTFKVFSGNLTTEAMGTSFNINQIDNEKLCISLVTGSVKINGVEPGEVFYLEPGLELFYTVNTKNTLLRKFSLKEKIGWKDGVLQFSNAGFQEVIYQLERWYGVNISVSGAPSENWQLSGIYDNQNLDLVLDRMAFIESFQYFIKDKKVQLKF
ncbi:MAG: FecR family protein [Cyclobacteriaceae bacterium]